MTVPPVPPEVPAIDPGSISPDHLAAPAPRKNRKHVYFGLGGLVVGLGVGLLAGTLVASSLASGAEAAAQDEAQASAAAEAQKRTSALPTAVEKCSASSTAGIEVMDQGMSLRLNTSGKKSSGAELPTVVCVLQELAAPDVLFTKLESTRALDGTQSTEWSGYTASWTYHPDDGLNIIVETVAK